MTQVSKIEQAPLTHDTPDCLSRRTLLKAAAAVGLGLSALGLTVNAGADDGTQQPEADSGHDYSMPSPKAKTAAQFYAGVIGPATLSVAASRMAVAKAMDADTRQFANFELREAIAVTAVIGSLNVPSPPISAEGQGLLNKLKTTSPGADFDKTYITAELANHEFLRDLAEYYLAHATGPADTPELYGRYVATLVITAFKEHIVLSKNILQAMKA